MKIVGDGTQAYIDHQPGNGTRYFAICVKLNHNAPDGYPGQWLVTFPEWGVMNIFHENGYIHENYVAEKMSRTRIGTTLGAVDIGEMTKVIARITQSKFYASTDETGHLP